MKKLIHFHTRTRDATVMREDKKFLMVLNSLLKNTGDIKREKRSLKLRKSELMLLLRLLPRKLRKRELLKRKESKRRRNKERKERREKLRKEKSKRNLPNSKTTPNC